MKTPSTSKHTAQPKRRKITTNNPNDNGMVIFPMSSEKLASTWVQNVDAILSEGTGTLKIDHLKTLKDKLTNTMTLITSRISELEIAKAERDAQEYIAAKIKYVSEQCQGKLVHVAFGGGQFNINAMITYAAIEGDKMHIKGLYPVLMQRNSSSYLAYIHSSIGQLEYKVPVKSLHFRSLDSESHFIMSSTSTPASVEFGCTFDQDYAAMIAKFVTEIREQSDRVFKTTPSKPITKRRNHGNQGKISNK